MYTKLRTTIAIVEADMASIQSASRNATGFEREGVLYDRAFDAYGRVHAAHAEFEFEGGDSHHPAAREAMGLASALDRFLMTLENSRFALDSQFVMAA